MTHPCRASSGIGIKQPDRSPLWTRAAAAFNPGAPSTSRASQLVGKEAIHHPPASSQSSLNIRQGAACRSTMAIHAALKLIPGCHLVRLKFSSLGCSSVIYANKSMHSHKICKAGHLSVWHNFQLSEPSGIPDTCRRKCTLPYCYGWQRGQGKAYLLPSMSSQRIHGARDRKDNAFCVTLNLLRYSSGCLILWIRDLYLFHLSREGDLQICVTLSILIAVYYLLSWFKPSW